jgi:hypothetical protein
MTYRTALWLYPQTLGAGHDYSCCRRENHYGPDYAVTHSIAGRGGPGRCSRPRSASDRVILSESRRDPHDHYRRNLVEP